jgi:hypothetical protein
MGVFRLYAEVANHLAACPQLLTEQSLDEIAAVYSPYAYIGSRKTLQQAVLRDAQRLSSCPSAPANLSEKQLAAWWFGRRRWEIDSGAFPDFVLAWEDTGTLGDGALLELKDSQGAAIASFNSTLPSARKSLGKLTALVREALSRYEACFRTGDEERDCFYLVRTHKRNPSECRLSLVHGTFFETLPTPQLLGELWGQLLIQADVPTELRQAVTEYLALLDRADVAQTRQISRASVKPRLRIMSEIHAEGNPHNYPEIVPHSVNLVLKPPDDLPPDKLCEWLVEQFRQESIQANNPHDMQITIGSLMASIRLIQHRRNGLHMAVQITV